MKAVDPSLSIAADLGPSPGGVGASPSLGVVDGTPDQPQSSPGIGRQAAAGFIAAISSAIVCRIVGLLGQVVLAWYLTKSDFGIAAVAVSASILLTLVREIGLIAMFSRHPAAFDRWASDAFWLSVVLAFGGSMCLMLALPLIIRQSDMPGLAMPTLLLAISWLFATPSIVPNTALTIQMRFRLVTLVTTVLTLLMTLLNVLLACLGAGAYAIVIPILVSGVLRLAIGLALAPIDLWKWPQFSRWRVMLAFGWPLFVSTLCVTIAMQGDNLILGFFQSESTVGTYYFAYQIVVQLLVLLGFNIGGILLPIFGKIRNDVRRQREAFLRACALLMAIAMPPFFLQAALAEPMLRLVWHEKWLDAALPLSILSVGTAFRLLGTVATPYVWSRGQLRQYLLFTVSSAAAFIVLVTFGAQFGTTLGVSIAVSVYYAVSEMAFALLALIDRRQGLGRRRAVADLVRVVLPPLLIGLTIAAAIWPLSHAVQRAIPGNGGPLLATVLGGVLGLLLHAGLLFVFKRELTREALGRGLSVFPTLGQSALMRRLAGLSLDPT